MRFIDLTGQKFGRLTAVRKNGYAKGKRILWLCECDCGVEHTVAGHDLRSGATLSCGCYKIDATTRRNTTHGETFNKKTSKEWRAWISIFKRCYNKRTPSYKHYGGRGIRVSKEWRTKNGFFKFLADMGRAPSPQHSIDRIDNNKGYSAKNCRWATRKEQANNTSRNRIISIGGVKKNLQQWSESSGIHHGTLLSRLKKGTVFLAELNKTGLKSPKA